MAPEHQFERRWKNRIDPSQVLMKSTSTGDCLKIEFQDLCGKTLVRLNTYTSSAANLQSACNRLGDNSTAFARCKNIRRTRGKLSEDRFEVTILNWDPSEKTANPRLLRD
jgi:hypothetical protein